MMPLVNITKAGLLRNQLIEPGWYVALIQRVGKTAAKGDNPDTTEVYPVDGVIVRNADTGSTRYAGVPTPYWSFNNNPRAETFIIDFLKALADNQDITEGLKELSAAEGRQIEVFIKNEEFQGRLINRLDHKYRPVRDRSTVPAA
jgi:hypothetical protein